MQPNIALLRVTPEDGATGVGLDATVAVDFGVAMDRGAVENGFHLIAESTMSTACPDSSMETHGTMDRIMDDPAMLRHMDAYHSTSGRYSWNPTGTVCTFHPDSLMRPEMRYMVHMSAPMLQMMQSRSGTMMDGRMHDDGDMMFHFQTASVDGHASHD